jgi:hypothetical protein
MFNEWKAAVLRHIPPIEDIRSEGESALGPAAAIAFGLMLLSVLSFGKRAGGSAAAWSLLAACGYANYVRGALVWAPERGANAVIEPWHWIPLLFLLFDHDGTFYASGDPRSWRSWVRRLAIAGLAAWVLVPVAMRHEYWPLAAFAGLITLGSAGSEAVARQRPCAVALALGVACMGASLVVLHAHSARFSEAISFPGAALIGIALVSLVFKVESSGAIPGTVFLLAAILLITQDSTFSEIPWYAFLLAGCTPLTIGIMSLPPLSRMTGIKMHLAFWILALGPTIAAITLAVRAESLVSEW